MSPSALALVLYNVLLYLVASDIKANVGDEGDSQYTIVHLIKTVGKWMMNGTMDETSSEFGDMFWTINAGVNLLLLVPTFVQVHEVRRGGINPEQVLTYDQMTVFKWVTVPVPVPVPVAPHPTSVTGLALPQLQILGHRFN
ncbi:GL23219 [Drosophila persimilis]|uniref:GL23219 n=1 Tax=Drosophila persimilis TaxID=7234 RepID=B4HBK8_DROPE|nr:GL23219 [Drosophila persimilis]